MGFFPKLVISDHAKTTQVQTVDYLKSLGFKCRMEEPVPRRSENSDRKGRIDIIAEKNGKVIAIEFDRKSPRKKSMYKLKNYECDFRFVLLRGGDKDYVEDGVYVTSIKVD